MRRVDNAFTFIGRAALVAIASILVSRVPTHLEHPLRVVSAHVCVRSLKEDDRLRADIPASSKVM